jgi:hypothetical protein
MTNAGKQGNVVLFANVEGRLSFKGLEGYAHNVEISSNSHVICRSPD